MTQGERLGFYAIFADANFFDSGIVEISLTLLVDFVGQADGPKGSITARGRAREIRISFSIVPCLKAPAPSGPFPYSIRISNSTTIQLSAKSRAHLPK